MTADDSESNVAPPPIVKTLTLLRVVLHDIDAIRRKVLTLPLLEQVPLRIALESLERKAQQLSTAARRISRSH